jgi:MOSC domain-containing protein YiiM
VAEILHLFQMVARGEPVREFEEVFAVENKGFQECLHGRSGSSRQVLLMDIETLEEFGIPPGRAKENITTRGIKLSGLSLGQRIRAGEALLEITIPCTPCNQMDEIRTGLQEELRGRRGLLCRVIEPGKIRRGERIEVVAPEDTTRNESTELHKGADE